MLELGREEQRVASTDWLRTLRRSLDWSVQKKQKLFIHNRNEGIRRQQGEVFVFDVRGSGGNWPVNFYNHEENPMEPFASNFTECIQRFEKGN